MKTKLPASGNAPKAKNKEKAPVELEAQAGSFTNDRQQTFLMFNIIKKGADSKWPEVALSLGKAKKLLPFLDHLKAFVASEGKSVKPAKK